MRRTIPGKWHRRMRRSALGGDKLLRGRLSRGVRLRIDAHDLDGPGAEVELDRLVTEQRDAFEGIDRPRVDALGERIAAVGVVVVPEDDVAGAEVAEQALEIPHSRAARDEVARDAHDVGAALHDPVDRVQDGSATA